MVALSLAMGIGCEQQTKVERYGSTDPYEFDGGDDTGDTGGGGGDTTWQQDTGTEPEDTGSDTSCDDCGQEDIPKVAVEPTGQTQCYSNDGTITCPPLPCSGAGGDFCGQDAQYRTADKSYNVQSTVTDNATGLIWQRENTGRTWNDAITYCEELEHDGNTDWRLPDYHELASLFHYGRHNPAIDTDAFPGTGGDRYWCSSYVPYEGTAWDLWFNPGDTDTHYDTHDMRVRCVRGDARRYPNVKGRFVESQVGGETIVRDLSTGIVWQKTMVSGKVWQDALTYCETLVSAGYSDWRLPNINELRSLINIEAMSPASDLPNAGFDIFWSSTTSDDNPRDAFHISFHDGTLTRQDKSNSESTASARCMRVE